MGQWSIKLFKHCTERDDSRLAKVRQANQASLQWRTQHRTSTAREGLNLNGVTYEHENSDLVNPFKYPESSPPKNNRMTTRSRPNGFRNTRSQPTRNTRAPQTTQFQSKPTIAAQPRSILGRNSVGPKKAQTCP